MTYILVVTFATYGLSRGVSISRFENKFACETVAKEVDGWNRTVKCIEVDDSKSSLIQHRELCTKLSNGKSVDCKAVE